MPLSSSCRNCGQSKPVEQYGDDFCAACTTRFNEGFNASVAENKDAPNSTHLYNGRQAMSQRAIRAGSNYVNPRDFSASRRGLPTRPGQTG
jgi:hypothetical protein